jgi:hypothetical protein
MAHFPSATEVTVRSCSLSDESFIRIAAACPKTTFVPASLLLIYLYCNYLLLFILINYLTNFDLLFFFKTTK